MYKIKVAIREKLYEVALKTFELTCFMFPLEDWEVDEDLLPKNKTGYFKSIVEFEGAAKGALIFSSSPDLANSIAANMLGIEEASKLEKEEAICEIANIICGNLVPLFATEKEICFIRPPRMLPDDDKAQIKLQNLESENIQLIMDEGVAEISIFYSEAKKDD